MKILILSILLCALFSSNSASAGGAVPIYIPGKGDGWSVSGGTVELNGALVSSLESSPKGFLFNRAQRGCGVIFKLTAGQFQPIYDFSSHALKRGCRVGRELMIHEGDIYGVTGWGGYDDAGTLFRITPAGTHHVVHRFNGRDGKSPAAGMVQGGDGRLYGVTQFGGLHDHGTVYRLSKSGRLTTLHHFSDGDPLGEFPSEGLTLGPDGAAYGVARYGTKGGGTVFKVAADGRVSLVKALGGANGCWPSRLTLGQDGWLYGAAFLCGDRDMGTLFRVHPSGAFERLHSFSGHDGSGPNYNLIQAPHGTWYGVTMGNPTNPTSVAYRTRFDGNGVTVLHEFGTVEAGIEPSGPLLFASDGFLYGTTSLGGNDKGFLGTGPGTVFRLAP